MPSPRTTSAFASARREPAWRGDGEIFSRLQSTQNPSPSGEGCLSVVHRGFSPIQNCDAGLLFDAIFGQGRPVYHTGGYLGNGETVWLLARLAKTITVGKDDVVQPYALMANSHDGSIAFNIRLTTVRVVCQNTLALAIKDSGGVAFRRRHQGSFTAHAIAAQEYFRATMRQLDEVTSSFILLSERRCSDEKFNEILRALIPDPVKPRNGERNPGLWKAWERKVETARAARARIDELRTSGKGQTLDGSRGTFWGVLNAILEYVDHHHGTDQSRIAYALLGDGMDLKMRAFRRIQDEATKAA